MFCASVLATPLLTNVPAVLEVHAPTVGLVPAVEPLHEKPVAEVEPPPSVTADPGAAAVTVNVVPELYEDVAPTAG